MKRVYILAITLAGFFATAYAQAPDTLWTRTYGGVDDDFGSSVQQTSDGGYIIAGVASAFGPGGSDLYCIGSDGFGQIRDLN